MSSLEYIDIDDENRFDGDFVSLSDALLPELPRQDELMWGESSSFSLPPINCMPSRSVITKRLESQTHKNLVSSKFVSGQNLSLSEISLSALGLPDLPKPLFSATLPENGGDVASENGIQRSFDSEPTHSEGFRNPSKKLAMAQYGTDDAALNRVLAATSQLLERMPTQSAVDCLIEMPVWMRNIFLARHGVTRIVGVMLSARLDAAGETSIVGPDGELSVHNIPGPVVETLSGYQLTSDGAKRESLLDQLVMVKKTRNIGVKIKNKNMVIQQTPIQQARALQRAGSR